MSTPINDGGAAFPRPVSFSEEGGTHRGTLGMTLRDYFAGQALAGIAARIDREIDDLNTNGKYFDDYANAWYQCAAIRAHCYADAMLAARARKEDSK